MAITSWFKCADRCSRLGDNGRQLTNLQMSEEQLKAFLDAVKADAGLQKKLKAAADADAVMAIAKAAGFTVTSNELNKTKAEVTEEELEGVAGGTFTGPLCGL